MIWNLFRTLNAIGVTGDRHPTWPWGHRWPALNLAMGSPVTGTQLGHGVTGDRHSTWPRRHGGHRWPALNLVVVSWGSPVTDTQSGRGAVGVTGDRHSIWPWRSGDHRWPARNLAVVPWESPVIGIRRPWHRGVTGDRRTKTSRNT